ncbi:hypothetical protein N665_0540s0002 [Sinapis alba]|nr:hypothetical protein N665_0540s0002 [Sinapis alba]
MSIILFRTLQPNQFSHFRASLLRENKQFLCETYVQLSTFTKVFCNCPSSYRLHPNIIIHLVCIGFHGALPVLNLKIVDFDVRLSFISQFDVLIVSSGYVDVDIPLEFGGGHRRFGITGVHICCFIILSLIFVPTSFCRESGFCLHIRLEIIKSNSVDLNRARVSLLEIVSGPDLRSVIEVAEYASEMQRIMRYLGVSNGNLQEGSLGCDVNISIRPIRQPEFRTKVENKNLNAFSTMSRAIDYEITRHALLYSKRKKEGLADYRYYPKPDFPEVILIQEYVESIHASLPELPEAKRRRYEAMGLSMQNVLFLANDVSLLAICGTIEGMIKEKDLVQINDPVEIVKMVMKYRSGRTKLQGFFAGQVMKTSKGKANHPLLNKILLEKPNAKE